MMVFVVLGSLGGTQMCLGLIHDCLVAWRE